jgi:hypothetical protein
MFFLLFPAPEALPLIWLGRRLRLDDLDIGGIEGRLHRPIDPISGRLVP